MTRNAPVHVTWPEGASRLFNLVIALLNADSPRPQQWIVDHVAGYQGSPKSKAKAFLRDREDLRHIGVLLRESTHAGQSRWSLDPEGIFLPPVSFSADERALIAQATEWQQGGELEAVAQTAYLKLAGAGVRRTRGPRTVVNVTDLRQVDPESVDALLRALERDLTVEATYYPSLVAEPQTRTIEPWAYAAVNGAMYLTGFDVDRGAQRTFRLSRLSDIRALGRYRQAPRPVLTTDPRNHTAPGAGPSDQAENPADAGVEPITPAELVMTGLQRSGTFVTPVLAFAADTGAEELRHLSGPVPRDWLVAKAAAYAPDVVVLEPADVVADVIAQLESTVELLAWEPRPVARDRAAADHTSLDHAAADHTSLDHTSLDHAASDRTAGEPTAATRIQETTHE